MNIIENGSFISFCFNQHSLRFGLIMLSALCDYQRLLFTLNFQIVLFIILSMLMLESI